MAVIKAVRVDCPLAGESHKGKWVERSEMIGIPIYRRMRELGGFLTEEETLKELCKVVSEVIVGWNLEDDTGKPLPEPYNNPEAFEKLAEIDSDAFIWILGVINTNIDALVEPPKKAS